MSDTCTCARIDGYRIRRKGCPRHNECLDKQGPVPKLDGATFVCTKPAGHDLPHEAPDGTWWEPPARGRFKTSRRPATPVRAVSGDGLREAVEALREARKAHDWPIETDEGLDHGRCTCGASPPYSPGGSGDGVWWANHHDEALATAILAAHATPSGPEDGGLGEDEVRSLYDALWETGCHGFLGDHPELVAAIERILTARLAAVEQRVADARAEERERIAQAIEAEAAVALHDRNDLREHHRQATFRAAARVAREARP